MPSLYSTVTDELLTGVLTHISSTRRRSYYLFHRAILYGFYLGAAANRERRLLNSVIGKIFRNCKGFEKSQFCN